MAELHSTELRICFLGSRAFSLGLVSTAHGFDFRLLIPIHFSNLGSLHLTGGFKKFCPFGMQAIF
jgi:hypothetical protein